MAERLGSNASLAATLADIGISQDELTNAVIAGYQNAATCTENDPPIYEGLTFWAKSIRNLREQLIPTKGWTRGNDRNYATVIRPDGLVQIAVAAGDSAVGNPDSIPRTRTEKGTLTKEAIKRNQLSFFFMDDQSEDAVPALRTWLLLHYVDEDSGEVRLELSLPAVMDETEHIVDWSSRVILPPILIERRQIETTEERDAGAYNVEVEPRRGS